MWLQLGIALSYLVAAQCNSWIECIARDIDFTEKVVYLMRHGFHTVDGEQFFNDIHSNLNRGYCVPFTLNLQFMGLPFEYFVAARVFYASLFDMHHLWSHYDETKSAYRLTSKHAFSIRSEISTLELAHDRLLEIKMAGTSEAEQEHNKIAATLLLDISRSFIEACGYVLAIEGDVGRIDALYASIIARVTHPELDMLRLSTEDYIRKSILPLLTKAGCEHHLGLSERGSVIARRVDGDVVVQVVTVPMPQYNATFRGMISHRTGDNASVFVESFIENFNFGGFLSAEMMICVDGPEKCFVNDDIITSRYLRHVAIAASFSPKLSPPLNTIPDKASVLVLGIGGGGILSFLLHHHANIIIDAVDIDPVVVDLAQEYFGLENCNAGLVNATVCRSNIIISDAWEYAKRQASNKITYDIIIYDLFDADVITIALTKNGTEVVDTNVKTLSHPTNIAALAAVLDPSSGIAILHIHKSSQFPLYESLIKQHFSDYFFMFHSGSYIVVAAHFKFGGDIPHPCVDRLSAEKRLEDFGKTNGYHKQIYLGCSLSFKCQNEHLE